MRSNNTKLAMFATLLGAALTMAPAPADADTTAAPFLSPIRDGQVPDITVHGSKDNGYYFGTKAVVAYAEAEDDDQLSATVYSGRKKLFEIKCRPGGFAGKLYRDFTDREKDIPIRSYSCDHRETVHYKGSLTVRYDYTSAATETTHKNIGERTVEVALLDDTYHALPEQWVGPVFYVHEWDNDVNTNELRTKMNFFTYMTGPQLKSLGSVVMRCTHDGNKLPKRDADIVSSMHSVYGKYELYRVEVRGFWSNTYMEPEQFTGHNIGQNPGKYECRMQVDGKSWRNFSFVVEEGKPLADPCGDALGFDAAHGVITTNKATEDFGVKPGRADNFLFQGKLPKACKDVM